MSLSLYIKNTYGSKRGLLAAFMCILKLYLGGYRRYKNIDVSQVKRFVFICAGNICRSPLAEYVAKQQGMNAISFGLDTRGGDSADARAIAFANTRGINLSVHISTCIKNYAPQSGDLLVGMEPKHAQQLRLLFGHKVPITLVGLWLNKPKAYIHDPYNTNATFFSACEQQVMHAVQQLVSASRNR